MNYDEVYYQQLIDSLLGGINQLSDEILDRGDYDETEDFVDVLSNVIMEFGQPDPEVEEYLEERGYGKRV